MNLSDSIVRVLNPMFAGLMPRFWSWKRRRFGIKLLPQQSHRQLWGKLQEKPGLLYPSTTTQTKSMSPTRAVTPGFLPTFSYTQQAFWSPAAFRHLVPYLQGLLQLIFSRAQPLKWFKAHGSCLLLVAVLVTASVPTRISFASRALCHSTCTWQLSLFQA